MQGGVCRECPDAIKNWSLTILAVLFGVSLIGAQTWITLRGAGVGSFLTVRDRQMKMREPLGMAVRRTRKRLLR
jgi:hypothetical protein